MLKISSASLYVLSHMTTNIFTTENLHQYVNMGVDMCYRMFTKHFLVFLVLI